LISLHITNRCTQKAKQDERVMNRIRELIGRRDLLKLASIGGIGLTATAIGVEFWQAWIAQAKAESLPELTPEPLNPDTALKRLLDGNQRFVQQKANHPDQSKARLQEVAQAQHPFATILSCADSRVPPEILFDEGIGDLFDVRIAGNVVNPEILGSLEYAVAALGSPLIMVLGHERCGAVTAAVKGKPLIGHLGSFVKAIEPAVKSVKGKSGDPVENAVIANVQYQVGELKQRSVLLTQQILAGKLKIVGGRYDLDTGEVSLIET
jgi:carbonic anhydrase